MDGPEGRKKAEVTNSGWERRRMGAVKGGGKMEVEGDGMGGERVRQDLRSMRQ